MPATNRTPIQADLQAYQSEIHQIVARLKAMEPELDKLSAKVSAGIRGQSEMRREKSVISNFSHWMPMVLGGVSENWGTRESFANLLTFHKFSDGPIHAEIRASRSLPVALKDELHEIVTTVTAAAQEARVWMNSYEADQRFQEQIAKMSPEVDPKPPVSPIKPQKKTHDADGTPVGASKTSSTPEEGLDVRELRKKVRGADGEWVTPSGPAPERYRPAGLTDSEREEMLQRLRVLQQSPSTQPIGVPAKPAVLGAPKPPRRQ